MSKNGIACDARATSVSSAEINVRQRNRATQATMMPSSAAENIQIKSQPHLNYAIKGV